MTRDYKIFKTSLQDRKRKLTRSGLPWWRRTVRVSRAILSKPIGREQVSPAQTAADQAVSRVGLIQRVLQRTVSPSTKREWKVIALARFNRK